MSELLRRIDGFLHRMDAKTVTSLGVSLGLAVLVVALFFFGEGWFALDRDGALDDLMGRVAASPWAILGVIAVFCALALTGFPQVLLITAAVLAFGPRTGALYAWIATMASATLTFALGHFLGGAWVGRLGGERVHRTISFIGAHGMVASGLVRVVPSAPFIVVNAAAGAAHIPLWKYWTGTGIGIVPKILVIAVLGAMASDAVLSDGVHGIVSYILSRRPHEYAMIALAIVLWLIFLASMRVLYRRLRRSETPLEN
ncbi:MAG: VTT domain-containing protein [Pseudomonadota bacterium]